jgi:MoaA/NifB/PqqE/SkfB family radical SAM enzyme
LNISYFESDPVSWLRQVFKRDQVKAERWRVLQIEVTSRCPLRCSFCPNKTLGANWIHGDLPWSVFADCIAPHLPRFDLAYLQGWGEPLLHPHLWEMIHATRAAGCRVGFTTCGDWLDEAKSARLLDEGVDILSVSFAGATPAMHESLRVGSDFRRLGANVECMARLKKERGLAAPIVELHFLMMRANMHELPIFVRVAASLGADEIVATNVTYAPTREVEAQRVFGTIPEPRHAAFVADAEREAKRLGIKFRAYPLTMDQHVLECDAQPTETAFVNHLGQVAPCVYLGLPVRGSAPRLFQGQDHPITPVNFGNVCLDLIAALASPERAKFAGAFRARKAFAYSALALSAASGMRDPVTLPEPPFACRDCYKLYGV